MLEVASSVKSFKERKDPRATRRSMAGSVRRQVNELVTESRVNYKHQRRSLEHMKGLHVYNHHHHHHRRRRIRYRANHV
jgi:hypothetical protein